MNALLRTGAAAVAATVLAASAWAAGPPASPAESNYQGERARCLAGQTTQARDTCLKEAGAAYEEARRHQLGAADSADLQPNATQRCEAQPEADRAACVQRILGGTAEGSVGGGGLIRRTETPVK